MKTGRKNVLFDVERNLTKKIDIGMRRNGRDRVSMDIILYYVTRKHGLARVREDAFSDIVTS